MSDTTRNVNEAFVSLDRTARGLAETNPLRPVLEAQLNRLAAALDAAGHNELGAALRRDRLGN